MAPVRPRPPFPHLVLVAALLIVVVARLRPSAATDAPQPRAAVNLVAVFEPQNLKLFSRILQKTVNEANAEADQPFQLVAQPMALEGHSGDTMKALCNALDRWNLSAILTVADYGTTLAAITVGGYAALPVLGIANGYSDQIYKLRETFRPIQHV